MYAHLPFCGLSTQTLSVLATALHNSISRAAECTPFCIIPFISTGKHLHKYFTEKNIKFNYHRIIIF